MILELLTAGIGISQIAETYDNNKKVKIIEQESLDSLAKARGMLENETLKTDRSLIKLANRRNSIYNVFFPFFLETIKPLDLMELEESERKISLEIESMLGDYIEIKTDFSISKLEMTNKQALTSYLLFGIPGFLKKKSEIALTNSKILKKNVDAYNLQIKTIVDFLIFFNQKLDIMSDLLVKMNVLFIRNLKVVNKIVEKKGSNKLLYSKEDRELLRLCFNLADAIKKLTTVSIMDNDNISKAFIEAIEIGEQQLNEIATISTKYISIINN